MFRTSNAKIWLRLAASIWTVLVLAWGGVIIWQDHSQRQAAIRQAVEFSLAVHDSTLAGLTALMIVERMDRSSVLLDQIRELDIVSDLRVVPSGVAFDGVKSTPAGPSRKHLAPNAEELRVIESGLPLVELRADDKGPYLQTIRPTPNAERYLGKNCVECHDAPVDAVLGVISMRVSLAAIDRALARQRGESLIVAVTVSLLLLGFIWTLIRAARKSLERAEIAAATDVLTGLPNRRGFVERLKTELERIKRDPAEHGCVLMIDLDHFKQVNDVHGHAAGDEVLRHFGMLLLAESRKSDVPGRVGGEEFALVLHDTHLEAARHIAERLRERVAATEVAFGDLMLKVTVSIGLAAIAADDLHYDEALGRADRALYRAKHEGRNRVRAAGDA